MTRTKTRWDRLQISFFSLFFFKYLRKIDFASFVFFGFSPPTTISRACRFMAVAGSRQVAIETDEQRPRLSRGFEEAPGSTVEASVSGVVSSGVPLVLLIS